MEISFFFWQIIFFNPNWPIGSSKDNANVRAAFSPSTVIG